MPSSPLRIGPRIQETTTTTGAGPLALAGATDGHFPFSAVQPVPVAITVPYLIAWAGGMEWGYGEISSDGTTLARVIVAGSYPGVWRNPGPGGQVNLPAGQKTVSLAVLDTQALVATGGGYAIDDPTGDVPPTCFKGGGLAAGFGAISEGLNAVAAGFQSWAGGNYGVALGAHAIAAHPVSRVIGGAWSIGDYSLTVGFEEVGIFAEQAAAGQAVSGTPFLVDFCWRFQVPEDLYWIDLTAMGANVARTQFRAVRRSLLVRGTTLQVTGADTVLVSTLGTVPTVTCTIGSTPDGEGNLPLHVSASSSGATAVDWRINATLRGG